MCGEATHQMAVRAALAERGCLRTEALAEAAGLTHRQVVSATGKLIVRGLVERVEVGCYRLTAEGEASHAAGEVLTSGPTGPHAAPRPPARRSLRARLWRAARLRRKFTIGELVRLAARDGERDPRGNATRYLALLCRAGYLRRLPGRQADGKPNSSGLIRYALVRDTGPEPPVVVVDDACRPTAMRDPNTGEVHPLLRRAGRRAEAPAAGAETGGAAP